jgi:hypothetical protein
MSRRAPSRRELPRRLLATLAVLGLGTHSSPANAFCRATTTDCDPLTQTCDVDAHGCLVTGVPLWWSGGDVQLTVNSAGSAALGITGDDARVALQTALSTWENATCPGGGHPDLHPAAPVLADGVTLGFDPSSTNQNVLVFFDDHWPFAQNSMAKTSLAFDLSNGEMRDADLAFNSQDYTFVTTPPAASVEVDLVAVLTHEVGHVLGLGHSDVPHATMQPETKGFATPELRTLEPDDMAGICAIYPPGKAPVQELTTLPSTQAGGCAGCVVPRSSSNGSGSPMAAVLAALGFAVRRGRRSRG